MILFLFQLYHILQYNRSIHEMCLLLMTTHESRIRYVHWTHKSRTDLDILHMRPHYGLRKDFDEDTAIHALSADAARMAIARTPIKY